MSQGPKQFRREAAIAALLTSPTLEAAAATAKVSVATLKRWRDDPTFASALRQAQRELLSRLTGSAASAALEALSVLRGIVADPEARPSLRLVAAKAVLDATLRIVERLDVLDRIEALERALAGQSIVTTARATSGSELSYCVGGIHDSNGTSIDGFGAASGREMSS